MTDLEPGWNHRKRTKYEDVCPSKGPHVEGLPGVVYLSDHLKVIDAKRQTGFNEDDLPPPFTQPRSFIDVPHHLLANDGFPSRGNWRDPACQKYISQPKARPPKHGEQVSGLLPSGVEEGLKSGANEVTQPLRIPPKLPTSTLIPSGVEEAEIRERLPVVEVGKPKQYLPNDRQPMGLPSLYDLEQGKEGVRVPVAGKVRRGDTTRHGKQAEKGIAARQGDVSLGLEASKPGVSFRKDCRRFNDPVLPVEDYVRTMEIVSELYQVIDHGHGQLVDRKTKKLICTFAFEDLETMDEDKRQEHQSDVDTVMKATELFRKLPTPSSGTVITIPPSKSSSITSKSNPITIESTHLPVPLGNINTQPSSPPIPANAATLCSSPLSSVPGSDDDQNDLKDLLQGQTIDILPEDLENRIRKLVEPTRYAPSSESSALTSLSVLEALQEEEQKNAQGTPISAVVKPKGQNVTTNGALLHGKMFCFGARAGYDREILYSPYIPRHGASLSLYKLFLSELRNFGRHVGSRFENFADEAFFAARNQLKTLNAPAMTAMDQEAPLEEYDFAGNFAFTFHNFFNKPHTDNDKGKVYCVWYPMDSVSRRIVTCSEGFWLEGGWFLFPEYRIAINFGTKYVVQIAWSGKSTFHQTMQSKEAEVVGDNGQKIHFTRLGCSSQITSSLAKAAVKLGTEEQWNHTSNCARKVVDCKDILNSKDRVWKE